MIAGTQAEFQSDAGSTKDTPYLALTGEIWGVFCEYFEKIERVVTAPHSIIQQLQSGMNFHPSWINHWQDHFPIAPLGLLNEWVRFS